MAQEGRKTYSEEELEAARTLAAQGEEAIKTAEISDDLILKTRAQIARAILQMEVLGLSVAPVSVCDFVQHSSDCLWALDLAGSRHTYISPAVEQLLGYTPEEFSSGNLTGVVRSQSLEKLLALHAELAAKVKQGELPPETPLTTEIEAIHKDGHSVFLEASMRIIVENGQPKRILGISRDVTHRKQLETQLLHAQKMEAVGQLAGGIAHDFNNLLQAVLGGAECISIDLDPKDPTQDWIRKEVQVILEAGKRAAGLTRQLLAFGRKQTLRPELISVLDHLKPLEEMARRTLSEDIHLSFELESHLDAIEMDPAQFTGVLLNLFTNARDAMPNGGHLRLSVSNITLGEADRDIFTDMQPGRYLRIQVQDTGTGIPPEHLERIFDPFFTTKEEGRGTGLGLASVYGTVKQSGGDIVVNSAVGTGTTFTMVFPSISRVEQNGADSTKGGEIVRGTGNVVVVEDDPSVLKVTQLMLCKAGYTVMKFQNGLSALSFFQQKDDGDTEERPFQSNEVDLVITDVKMPQMNGTQLAEELRALCPEIKILFISGHTDETHGINLTDLTRAPFIQKPFSSNSLSQKVHSLLTVKADE